MNILLTGANGQVGWEIVQRAGDQRLLALDRAGLDITDAAAVDRVLGDSGAEIVINAAAYTGVDKAEQESTTAFAVNRDGPAHLAAACARLKIPLLHLSTDYVFDGGKSGAYTEADKAAPLGVYGQSKWQGEEAVRRHLPEHIILRISWVFGRHGHNFVRTMQRLARERESLRVVADQHGCPTYAGHIAEVVLALAARLGDGATNWGTYHYCDSPATTWHGFTEAIVAQAKAREAVRVQTVTPITTADYPTPAARPANSVLDCGRIRECFGIEPKPWAAGLAAMFD